MSVKTRWGSVHYLFGTWGGRDGHNRLKTIVARNSKHRDIAPKRRKVLRRHIKGKK